MTINYNIEYDCIAHACIQFNFKYRSNVKSTSNENTEYFHFTKSYAAYHLKKSNSHKQ